MARLSEKSGYYLSDILLEKCAGVMRDDGGAADCSYDDGKRYGIRTGGRRPLELPEVALWESLEGLVPPDAEA